MTATQDQLIGHHPIDPHIFAIWLECIDQPCIPTKKHRSLSENNDLRNQAIDQFGKWIVDYHFHDHSRKMIIKQKEILEKHNLDQYIDNLNILPTMDNTRKGNLGEIILTEYLKESKKFEPLICKLRYNPNTNQSMKGDDVLMFNQDNLNTEVLYGECKFRSKPSKQVVKDIVENLEGKKRLPISMEFVANRLEELGHEDLADSITDLHMKILDGTIPVICTGFLISTKSSTPSKDTYSTVETHLTTSNPNMVMISLGIDDPEQIIRDAYVKADSIIKSI